MTHELIALIRKRIAKPDLIHDMARSMSPVPQISLPATPRQIAATEAKLGFALPPLYRQLLIEIGSGHMDLSAGVTSSRRVRG